MEIAHAHAVASLFAPRMPHQHTAWPAASPINPASGRWRGHGFGMGTGRVACAGAGAVWIIAAHACTHRAAAQAVTRAAAWLLPCILLFAIQHPLPLP